MQREHHTASNPPQTSSVSVKLHIEGMTCAGCVAGVEKALRAVPGVRRASVILTTESATVDLESPGVTPRTLIDAIRAAGYDAESLHTTSALNRGALDDAHSKQLVRQRQAMVQAVGLGLPVVALDFFGPLLQSTDPGAHVWWQALQGLLCTLLLCSPAGAPILVAGLRSLRHRSPNMSLLISLGVSAAYGSSLVSLFTPSVSAHHFHAAAMILALINVGKYLETRARREASSAVAALARRLPKTAVREREGHLETVPLDRVRVGDRLRIAQDVAIPVDGRVVDGSAAVDQSTITGESMPVARTVGDTVLAGGIVHVGLLVVEATAVGEASTLAAILRAVEDAQSGKTRLQRLADRLAGVFVPIVVLIAVLTLLGHLTMGSTVGRAAEAVIAVLVIACPCAMGLATPTAVLVATSQAALVGILVRDAASLEAAGRIDEVVFDKTGTLTTGIATVSSVVPVEPTTQDAMVGIDAGESGPGRVDELLRLAGAVEQDSRHPLAVAVVQEARRRGIALAESTLFKNYPGLGVAGVVGRQRVVAGSLGFLEQQGIELPPSLPSQSISDGQSFMGVAADGRPVGVIAFRDQLRPTAAAAVAALRAAGLDVSMVTGDQHAPAQAAAAAAGIDRVLAEALPDRKRAYIEERRRAGRRVAFVGDGVNDAPALAAANVGMAFASGTDVALAAADITLVRDDLTLVPTAMRIARRSVRIIKQNLFWAFLYNVAALPLAATGHVPPALAAAAMMASSLSVILNSLRLRRVL